MTWYSMMDLATGVLSLPVLLAAGVSLAFDGGAIFLAMLSIEYAKTADSGVLAELGTFLFIGTSVYIVVQHAVLANYGTVGQVMFGAAPVIVAIIFKAYLNFLTRKARKDAGRVVERLPVAGKLTWLRYPRQSFRLLSIGMQTRLIKAADRLDMPQDKYGILQDKRTPIQGHVGHPVEDTETSEKDKCPDPRTEIKTPQISSETLVHHQLTTRDNLSLPVWLPSEPQMSLGTLVRTCLDNGVLDLETMFKYAKDIKGQEVNKMSLSRTLTREKAKLG
jgi:hypothetical protein